MKRCRMVLLAIVLLMLFSTVAGAGGARITVPQAPLLFAPLPNCGGDVVGSAFLPMGIEGQEKGLRLTARLMDSPLWDERIALTVDQPGTFVTLGREPVVVLPDVAGNVSQELKLAVRTLADHGVYSVKILWALNDASGAEQATAVTEVRMDAL